MSKPAARITDMHTCPLVDPGPKPHVGGPITGPGEKSVLIGGLPAALLGDQAACAGAPDKIVTGSATVLIGGMPAARMGDTTAHGGVIVKGFARVLIGDGVGTASGQAAVFQAAAGAGRPFCSICSEAPIEDRAGPMQEEELVEP